MSEYRFKMPDIGEGVVEAEITEWYVKVGDKVAEDTPVADAMTDKATIELTAPVSGTITLLGCEAGGILAVGADLVVFDTEGKDLPPQEAKSVPAEKPAPQAASKPEPKKEPEPLPAPVSAPKPAPTRTPAYSTSAKPLASPAVRKAAQDKGIDLTHVTPTGKAGQITHDDLTSFKETGGRVSGYEQKTGGTDIKVVGMRRIIAERMSEAKRRIPHFSYVEAVDMTNIEELRAHLNAARRPDQPKLTLIPFFMRAIVKAAALWPQCNATFDDEAGVVTQHNAVHLGMAAQTPNGLMVPVVRHAESLDVWQAATEIARLGEAAKTGSIAPGELSGSTITLTSLGPLGGVVTTPVINRPEVAILGPNKIVETPVVKNGQITVRKMMNFSSSFDHRVVDGFHAAEMITYIKGLLENPATLFME